MGDLGLRQGLEVAGLLVDDVDDQLVAVELEDPADLLAGLEVEVEVGPVGGLDLAAVAGADQVLRVGHQLELRGLAVDQQEVPAGGVDADEGLGGDGLLLVVRGQGRADGDAGHAAPLDAQPQLGVVGAVDVAVEVVQRREDQRRRLDVRVVDVGRVVAEDQLHQGAELGVGARGLAVAAGAVDGDRVLVLGHDGLDHGVGQLDLAVADLVEDEHGREGLVVLVLAHEDAVRRLGGRQLVHLQAQPGGDVDRLADHDHAVEGLTGDGLGAHAGQAALLGVGAVDGLLVVVQGAHWHTSCFVSAAAQARPGVVG